MEPGNSTTGSPKNGFWPNPREEGFFKTPSKANTYLRSKFMTDRAQTQGHRIYLQEENCFLFSEIYVPTTNKYEQLIYVNDDNEYDNTDFNIDISNNDYHMSMWLL